MQFTREGRIAVPGGQVWYGIAGEGEGVPLLALHGGPGSHMITWPRWPIWPMSGQ